MSPSKYSLNVGCSLHSGVSAGLDALAVGRAHAVDRPEQRRQAVVDDVGRLLQRALVARAGRDLDGERVAEEAAVGAQLVGEQHVDREPDRPAPVGVAAEHRRCATRPARTRSTRFLADGLGGDRRRGRPPTATGCRTATGTRPSRTAAPGCGAAAPGRRSDSSIRRPPAADRRCNGPTSSGRRRCSHAKPGGRRRGTRRRSSDGTSVAPRIGSSPTIERTRMCCALPSGLDQDVVEEPVVLVPQRHVLRAEGVHRLGDRQEVLEELGGDVVPRLVVPGQLQRDLEHLLAVEGHPARGVGLLQPVAGRQRRRAVEQADVVHPEEAALEQVGPVGVLAVDPPGEVEQQLGEHPDRGTSRSR